MATHTKTRTVVEFADPYKVCTTCFRRVVGFLERPGPPTNHPCGHKHYADSCPSWGPVDGCTCLDRCVPYKLPPGHTPLEQEVS